MDGFVGLSRARMNSITDYKIYTCGKIRSVTKIQLHLLPGLSEAKGGVTHGNLLSNKSCNAVARYVACRIIAECNTPCNGQN